MKGALRVLLIADHCSPAQTSVPLVSWYYYMALRKRVAVHLVTHARNREPITRRLEGRVEGITFVDSDAVHRPLLKMVRMLGARNGKGWTMISAAHTLAFYWFERLALREFGPRVASGEFDIVHRLTPLSTATPSSVIHRWRAPVVLGPLNGGLPWPPGFENVRTKEREWLSPFRRLTRHLPGWRRTFRVASCVISGSVDAWRQLEGVAAGKHVYLPRNGVDTGAFADSERPGRDASRPLEVVFVGRLVPYKGADVMLEACAGLMRAGRVRVTIAGKGPQLEELKGVVERLGVGGAVVFRGDVPHAELPGLYAASDVFVMPSIREFGGAVVLEAMSCGVPVVVADYGGPGELATPEVGCMVPLTTRAALVEGVREAVEGLERDRGRLVEMGRAARRRAVEMFDWDAKAGQLVGVYEWVAGGRRGEPPQPVGPVRGEEVGLRAGR